LLFLLKFILINYECSNGDGFYPVIKKDEEGPCTVPCTVTGYKWLIKFSKNKIMRDVDSVSGKKILEALNKELPEGVPPGTSIKQKSIFD